MSGSSHRAESTREFCGCSTYEPGFESGMVVCWKCEQIVSHIDEEGAITTTWMQQEIVRLRLAMDVAEDTGAIPYEDIA